MTLRIRHLAHVNPSTPAFDTLPPTAELTFMPLETVWPDARLDTGRATLKADVSSGYVRFQDGDVLVPKTAPTFHHGRATVVDGLVNGVGAGSSELHLLRPKTGVDARFLSYVTRSSPFVAKGVTAYQGVAGLQRVPADFLADWPVAPLTNEELRRVADFLDDQVGHLDAAIRLRQKQQQLADHAILSEIAAALTGRHLSPRQPSGTPWLGDIPSSWSMGPVHGYYDVQLGKMLNEERSRGPNLLPYLRNANVHWFDISTHDLKLMHFESHESARYQVLPGDLLVCEGGAGVAEAAVWDGQVSPCYFSKSLHRVRSRSYLPVEWLMFWLRIAKDAGVFEAEGNLATIPHLTGEQLRVQRIPVPPAEDVFMQSLRERRHTLELFNETLGRSTALLEERKQALITAAVTGQFDVTTARAVA